MARFAICIGVSAQSDAGFSPIEHSARDADAFAVFLAGIGQCKPTLIIDPESGNVKKKVWETLKELKHSDQVVIFFSGHGRRSKARKLHLCLTDTFESDLPATSLSLDSLIEMVREADASTALIVLDCCYSGSADRSLLIKGDDAALSAHEHIIRDSSGLSVLTSTSSVDPSLAHQRDELSVFTGALISTCNELAETTNEWITVSRIYESLKFNVAGHSPKLIGENTVFPVCKGSTSNAGSLAPHEISFQLWNQSYPVFVGILLSSQIKAWLIMLPLSFIPHDAVHLEANVYVLYNRHEIFRSKIDGATARIISSKSILAGLSRTIGQPLLILFPVEVDEVAFKRYSSIDRKYIFNTSHSLRHSHYMSVSSSRIYSITECDGDYMAFNMPEDYMKEMLGVELIREANDVLRLEEGILTRNRKALILEAKTNKIIGSIVTGASLVAEQRIFDSAAPQLMQSMASKRAAPALPASESGRAWQGIEGTTEQIVFQFSNGRWKLNGELVETDFQMEQIRKGIVPACEYCFDEREQVIKHNLRLYRVPCASCNSQKNQSWRPFWQQV